MTEDTFVRVAGENKRLLYHVAYTLLRDNRECEDAVQEALCRAWEKRDTLRDEQLFKAWLTRILANTCHSLQRRRRAPTEKLSCELPAPDAPEDEGLHEALGQLPKELRLAIVLYYLEGFSTKEIARITGRPEGTVRNRIHRGRERLKELLKEEIE